MNVLVTGGAGYIGSHMIHALTERGDTVIVLDDLSTGTRGLVAPAIPMIVGDAGDVELVSRVLAEQRIEAILHFAGSIVVPQSIADPLGYYANNAMVSRNLIAAAVAANVKNFIFSSTATVYAGTEAAALTEDLPVAPASPYGRSKLMTEWMLEDSAQAYALRYVILRYFNVAGADPLGRSGQCSREATHLIKRACQAGLGRVPHIDIFGADFPTPDGTGMRDYVHVTDLVAAHALALDYLHDGGASTVMNCGYGHGTSVRDVIAAVERVIGRKIPVKESARRPGDPPWLVSDPSRIRKMLGWTPRYDDLDTIVRTAYEWERKLNSA